IGGDGEHLDPRTLLDLPIEKLREAGLSQQKAGYLRDICGRVLDRRLRFEDLERLDDEAVIDTLSEIKGVGRWTAEVFLMFRLGRRDVLPAGDLGIQKGFIRLFNLRKPPARERMEK